jgi:hypothetical protein
VKSTNSSADSIRKSTHELWGNAVPVEPSIVQTENQEENIVPERYLRPNVLNSYMENIPSVRNGI